MHILIIEDEKKIASFITKGLKEEGFTVSVAYDGQQGYDVACSSTFDLILLDLMIPKIDGILLCKQLRACHVKTPIIILTAKNTITEKVNGLDAGANDYITKPFAFEELLARIRTHTRLEASKRISTLVFGDLQIDLLTHKVKRGDLEIVLTTKEFSLLEFFVRNPNKLVTRTMLLENVWDINFDTTTNIIDVYIYYLRRKLKTKHAKPLIHAIRGRGYILKL